MLKWKITSKPIDSLASERVPGFSWVIAITALVAVLAGSVRVYGETAGNPDIALESDEIDFGEVRQHAVLKRSVVIRNKGDAELVIGKVTSTCGCTATILSSKIVPPGGETELTITYQTKSAKGKQSKRVYIASNDPDTPNYRLNTKATIVPLYEFTPEKIDFGKIVHGEKAVATFTVKAAKADTLKIVKAECADKRIDVSLLPADPARPAEREVKVELSEKIPAKVLYTTIKIQFDDEFKSKGRIRVSAVIEPMVKVSPSAISFGARQQGDEIERRVKVSSKLPEPIAITGIDNPLVEYITVTSNTEVPGKLHVIALRLRPDVPKGKFKGSIVVRTDSSDYAELPIKVFGMIRERKAPESKKPAHESANTKDSAPSAPRI
ncbi:DUF1573 domain-containing protein [Candidatus Hydrogenedentota bacterium]